MPSSYQDNPTASAQLLLHAFALPTTSHFAEVLNSDDLDCLLRQHGLAGRPSNDTIYNPVLTIWAFLSQCLCTSKDLACALTKVIALLLGYSLDPCSAATGAYSLARSCIPVAFFADWACLLGRRLQQAAPATWLWHGLRVVLVDGTTLSGYDNQANQAKYPQSKSQKPGLGFPLVRLVVLIGLATGALLGAALAPWTGAGNGEISLLAGLLGQMRPGELLLADRNFGCYALVATLKDRGLHGCLRVMQKSSIRGPSKGKKIGEGDYLVDWLKPGRRPVWMSQQDWALLPATIQVREIHTRLEIPGFRTKLVVLVTTLLEAVEYPADDIRELYRLRWHVELDIRNIKSWMGMDILRGKSPEMMEREVWGHLVVYNLVRRLQAQAALLAAREPRQLSFTQALKQYREYLAALSLGGEVAAAQAKAAVSNAAIREVGNRPDRSEPRRLKRRPKDCKLLTKPRAQARQEVLAGAEADKPKTIRRRKFAAATATATATAPVGSAAAPAAAAP